MNENAKKRVVAQMGRAFPNFPVVIQESPEDSSTFWVRVFAVPAAQVRAVKDFIHDLEDKLPADGQAILLPMVKSLEVTQQYYPEFMPPELVPAAAALDEQFLLQPLWLVPSEWEISTINLDTVHAGDYQMVTVPCRYDIGAIMGAQLQQRQKPDRPIAANSDLALAA